MVLTTKQFDAIANYADTISYLKDQLDQRLTDFAKLGKKQRKEQPKYRWNGLNKIIGV